MLESGEVLEAPGEKWGNLDGALSRGRRGLPGGSTLAQLLAEKRGVRNLQTLPDLTPDQILKWADAHHVRTGQWPNIKSGEVPEAPGQKWAAVSGSLHAGNRGLPGGSSLAKLLAEKRGVRNLKGLPDLTIEKILKWADAHHKRTGQWPNAKSGEVISEPGEKWQNINAALFKGLRGLPGGSSLPQLLAEKRGVRTSQSLPDLTTERILRWADAHHRRTGQWPNAKSGELSEAPEEKWRNIQNALFIGFRGLSGGSSLPKLLEEKRGVRNPQSLPDLTIEQILKWADAHRMRTGQWPKVKSGEVLEAPGEKWANIDAALSQGRRGLSGGSSLAMLIQRKRTAK
jgi:hypothetical protein